MEMRAGRPAGVADPTDQISADDLLAGGHLHLAHVGVQRGEAAAVRDDDSVAIAGPPIGGQDNTTRRSHNRIPGVPVEVDPVVVTDGAEDRMNPLTERARDDTGDRSMGEGERTVRTRPVGPRGGRRFCLGCPTSRFLCESERFGFLASLFLGESTGLLFEPSDLLGDLSVSGFDLVTDRLPLGHSVLYLGTKSLRLFSCGFEVGEAVVQFSTFGLCFGKGQLGIGLGGFLLGDCCPKLIDEVVLVADDLFEKRATDGGLKKVGGVEFVPGGCFTANEGIDGSFTKTKADHGNLLIEQLGSLDGGLSRILGSLDGTDRCPDLGLLQRNVTIDGGKRLDEVSIFRGQGVDRSGRLGSVSAGVLAGVAQVVDGVLGDRSRHHSTAECERRHGTEQAKAAGSTEHSPRIVTEMQ